MNGEYFHMARTECENCSYLRECLVNKNTVPALEGSAFFYSRQPSCYFNQKYYWNIELEMLTTDNSHAPIRKWNGDSWLESWWIEEGKSVIDFSYTKEEKNTLDINEKRKKYFSDHGYQPTSIRCVMIPKEEYENRMV